MVMANRAILIDTSNSPTPQWVKHTNGKFRSPATENNHVYSVPRRTYD
jgi:hypothetical protein